MSKNKNKNNQKKQEENSKLNFLKSPYIYIIFAVVIFLLYFRILGFPLGKLDEDAIITGNLPFISHLSNIGEAFTRGAFFNTANIMFYRPLQNISFMLDAQISGGNIWGFYFFNLIFHLLTCIGVFLLLKKLKFDELTAFLSTLIFAVNPLFTHSIAWIPSRGDILIGMFGVFWFINYISFSQKKNYLSLLLSGIFYFAAMLSKESAIVFPGIVILYILLNESRRKKWEEHLLPIGVYLSLAILYLLIRNSFVNSRPGGDIFGLGLLIGNLQTLPELFGKYFLPVNLSPMPGFSILSTSIGILLIGMIAYMIYKADKEKRFLYFVAFGWFLIGVFPGMLFSRDFGEYGYQYLEHRAYMPSVGISVIIGLIISKLTSNQKIKKNILYAGLLIVIVFAGLSFLRTNNYKDALSFYDYAVESNPKSAMALNNRGTLKNNKGNKQGAIEDYMEAIRLKTDYAESYNNAGIVYADLKNHNEAIQFYNKAIQLKADYYEAYYNRAISKIPVNDIAGAMSDYAKAIESNPNYAQAYVNRGILKRKLNDFNGAIEDCNKAIQINPNVIEAWLSRATTKFNTGDFAGAVADYDKAITLNPKDATIYMNKGAAKFQMKDFKGAIHDFSSAVSIDSRLDGAYFYRALSFQSLGRSDEMCNDLKISASLGNPNASSLMKQICK